MFDKCSDDLEGFARDLAGNWRKWNSFAWHRADDADASQWGIIYTRNRDSDALDQCNAEVIGEELAPFVAAGDVTEENHAHWAVGWVEGFAVRVYDSNGRILPAVQSLFSIKQRLDQYPSLDDDRLSAIEAAVEAGER